MRAGNRSTASVQTSHAAAAAAARWADELRVSEPANASEANGIFCHLAWSPCLPSFSFMVKRLLLQLRDLTSLEKIIKIQPNDETLAAKRP